MNILDGRYTTVGICFDRGNVLTFALFVLSEYFVFSIRVRYFFLSKCLILRKARCRRMIIIIIITRFGMKLYIIQCSYIFVIICAIFLCEMLVSSRVKRLFKEASENWPCPVVVFKVGRLCIIAMNTNATNLFLHCERSLV